MWCAAKPKTHVPAFPAFFMTAVHTRCITAPSSTGATAPHPGTVPAAASATTSRATGHCRRRGLGLYIHIPHMRTVPEDCTGAGAVAEAARRGAARTRIRTGLNSRHPQPVAQTKALTDVPCPDWCISSKSLNVSRHISSPRCDSLHALSIKWIARRRSKRRPEDSSMNGHLSQTTPMQSMFAIANSAGDAPRAFSIRQASTKAVSRSSRWS